MAAQRAADSSTSRSDITSPSLSSSLSRTTSSGSIDRITSGSSINNNNDSSSSSKHHPYHDLTMEEDLDASPYDALREWGRHLSAHLHSLPVAASAYSRAWMDAEFRELVAVMEEKLGRRVLDLILAPLRFPESILALKDPRAASLRQELLTSFRGEQLLPSHHQQAQLHGAAHVHRQTPEGMCELVDLHSRLRAGCCRSSSSNNNNETNNSNNSNTHDNNDSDDDEDDDDNNNNNNNNNSSNNSSNNNSNNNSNSNSNSNNNNNNNVNDKRRTSNPSSLCDPSAGPCFAWWPPHREMLRADAVMFLAGGTHHKEVSRAGEVVLFTFSDALLIAWEDGPHLEVISTWPFHDTQISVTTQDEGYSEGDAELGVRVRRQRIACVFVFCDSRTRLEWVECAMQAVSLARASMHDDLSFEWLDFGCENKG